ncbi:hypothetical protein P872_24905 [Rhodonellum psychrophilum GCM71 = DSM 17998]|uniref:Outer membrane protein beta-barrel domain-containing protein n=1 Tax=Rhodonellum psychrophilum GCM71 = DSM 17998 TaxID=1123057 RepID=U5C3N1_9BACT|nr:hypothetical protein P872_24905 [Rhodonellum psychrophilum GCM71 = DSM 17998]
MFFQVKNPMVRYFILTIFVVFIAFGAQSQSPVYVNHTEIGPMFGKSNDYDYRVNFSIQTFNGVKINPNHEVGFLVGLDTYSGLNLMPVALGWRGIREKGKRTSPYLSLDLGYGSALLEKRDRQGQRESWYEGGSLFSPAIGLRRKSRGGKSAFSWSLGFKRQGASFYEGVRGGGLSTGFSEGRLPPGFISVREENYVFNSLLLKWGLVF